MHVDRTRFLMLTAAMAASCGAQQKQEPEPIVARPDDYDTTAGSAPQPVPVENSQIAKEELVEPPPEPPPPVMEDPGGEWMPPPQPGLAAQDPALSRRCASIKRPGPVCESFLDTVDSCSLYSTVMVPKAASAAVSCLTKRSGTKRICEFGVDAVCALQGTKSAPKDSSAKSTCSTILSSCAGAGYRGKDLTRANCEAAVSGYLSSVRSRLVSCATEFCELGPCFYSLAR